MIVLRTISMAIEFPQLISTFADFRFISHILILVERTILLCGFLLLHPLTDATRYALTFV